MLHTTLVQSKLAAVRMQQLPGARYQVAAHELGHSPEVSLPYVLLHLCGEGEKLLVHLHIVPSQAH